MNRALKYAIGAHIAVVWFVLIAYGYKRLIVALFGESSNVEFHGVFLALMTALSAMAALAHHEETSRK